MTANILQINIKKLDLKNIVLSFNNPRWKDIPSLNTNLIEMIVQKSDATTEKEVIKKLLELEGNLDNFVDLIRNIANGFRDYEQGIFVVQKNSYQYIVARGNRRILALKLLNNFIKLPRLSEIRKNFNSNDGYAFGNQKKYLENYERIKKIINLENRIYGRTEFNCWIVNKNQNEILWEIIFSKNIGGAKIGLRRWGRGKYFVDLLNFFSNGMKAKYDKLEQQRIESQLQRKLIKLKQDYKHAQFVYEIVNSDLKNSNKAKEWMKKRPVSALQSNFCLIPLKKIAQVYGYKDEDFKKFIFDFCYDEENYLLRFVDDKNKIIKSDQVLIFIKEWFEKGLITTRQNIEENKQYFNFGKAFAKLIEK